MQYFSPSESFVTWNVAVQSSGKALFEMDVRLEGRVMSFSAGQTVNARG